MSLVLMPFARRVAAMLTRCHHAIVTVCHPYRPELYYMRGPGPKWRAKRQLHSGSSV